MLSSLMLKIPRIDCKLQQTYIKKVGNAHRKPLAYPSSVCIQTTQNGKIDFEQCPVVQKRTPRWASQKIYFLMVIPRIRSTPRKIFAAALSASSTVKVWSALRRETENETLFLPSPS